MPTEIFKKTKASKKESTSPKQKDVKCTFTWTYD